jgi:hypothetical protein
VFGAYVHSESFMCGEPDYNIELERVMGIEPTFSAWEADVLPLNYTRISGSYASLGNG